MSFLRDLTGGNPFATQVGQLIDQATDGSQASENWGLLMEICDILNETEDGPKDAMKAIKKKLSMNVGKNYTAVMYTLTVLETCVKNCGKRFHVYIATKDFMGELVKVIGPKNDPPQVVQEKILSLIQTWADAFTGIAELKEVCKVYIDLKNKGIEFPMTDLDAMAPIHTPAKTTQEAELAAQSAHRAPTQQQQQRPAAVPTQPPPHATVIPVPAQMAQTPAQMTQIPAGPIRLSSDQLGKLKSELDVVQENCRLLSEMLTELTPGQENPTDLELLQDLHQTCRQMQQRIVQIIDKVQNEDVTCELLRVNDELNNVFLRYDRFERLRGGAAKTTATQPPIAGSVQPAPTTAGTGDKDTAVANLIDLATPDASQQAADPFVGTNDVQSQMAGMNLAPGSVSSQLEQLSRTNANTAQVGQHDDDFDMFAQSRQSFEQSKSTLPSYRAEEQNDVHQGSLGSAVSAKNTGNPKFGQEYKFQDKPGEFDEMEQWLEKNPEGKQESATSSEFDRFLAERAREADSLPDADPARGTRGRQLQKDDATDSALFAL